jgi:flavin-dependent dehydrogenase
MKNNFLYQNKKWDVVVVGAGPGGAVAAKKCVGMGFSTLLLEKRALPRDKVCSGMIMGPWACEIIDTEFGTIPQEVLTTPSMLKGHMIHVPGAFPEALEWSTPLAWRKDFDFWLTQKAKAAGVEVWEKTKVIAIDLEGSPLKIRIATPEGDQTITTEWIVGAVGAGSIVRKSLFPELSMEYSIPLRECYSGSLTLEKDYCHWFFPRCRPRPRFNVNHKGNYFLIEGSGIRELREDINRSLAEYRFDPLRPPDWKDGCLIPKLHGLLISGSFSPAKGNTLLIGDAAGLLFPITFEGIGTALKSGILAADSIRQAAQEGQEAAPTYLRRLKPILEQIEFLMTWQKKLEHTLPQEPEALAGMLKEVYEKTLKID